MPSIPKKLVEECAADSPGKKNTGGGIVNAVADFLQGYVVLPRETLVVIAAWVVASWMMDVWDRFPHLGVTSPEKRCGKTLLLRLIEQLVRNPRNTANISPAAIYRLIGKEPLTLLLDEAQSLSRRSESSEVTRELLNASIDRNAKVIRCGGSKQGHAVEEFPVYCPKVVALIGRLDAVLADRCVPVRLERKSGGDEVLPYRSRKVEPLAAEVRNRIESWAGENREAVQSVFDKLEPFDIENDRMAELLMPLQSVAIIDEQVSGPIVEVGGVGGVGEVKRGDTEKRPLVVLRQYAQGLDEKEKNEGQISDGVMLLAAIRDIYCKGGPPPTPNAFIPTDNLLCVLVQRDEEPWGDYNHGKPISKQAFANLLKEYSIKSERDVKQKHRGYYAKQFVETWSSYLPQVSPLKTPPTSATPATSANPGRAKSSPASSKPTTTKARKEALTPFQKMLQERERVARLEEGDQ